MALPRLCTWPPPRPALGQPSSSTPALPALRGCCQHKLPEQPEPVGREQELPAQAWVQLGPPPGFGAGTCRAQRLAACTSPLSWHLPMPPAATGPLAGSPQEELIPQECIRQPVLCPPHHQVHQELRVEAAHAVADLRGDGQVCAILQG